MKVDDLEGVISLILSIHSLILVSLELQRTILQEDSLQTRGIS